MGRYERILRKTNLLTRISSHAQAQLRVARRWHEPKCLYCDIFRAEIREIDAMTPKGRLNDEPPCVRAMIDYPR